MNIVKPLSTGDYIDYDKECNLKKLSIHKSVCNFVYGNNNLLSFVTENIGNGPFNVIVKDNEIEFIKEITESGDDIWIKDDKIYFGDRLCVELGSKRWNSKIDLRFNINDKKEFGDIMKYYIQRTNRRGLSIIFSIIQGDKIIANSLDIKIAKLVKNNFLQFVFQHNPEYLTNIIGVGRGLTPSADDFIRGVLTGLQYFLSYDVKNRFGRILQLSKTSIISRNYLIGSLDGRIDGQMKEFLHSIGRDDSVAKLERVMATGESSGIDYLAGFFITFMYKDEILKSGGT